MHPITVACLFACSTTLISPAPTLAQQTVAGQIEPTAQVAPQESSWIQIEAQSSLLAAQDRIRDYGQTFANVAGFDLGSGWYGILLGPYTAKDARASLLQFRREGLVPRDSFVQFPSRLQRQFFPTSARFSEWSPLATATALEVSGQTQAAPPTLEIAEPAPTPQFYTPDETRAEARRSEQLLSREDKKELQRALAWAGVYKAGIDGSYGRGTRGAMLAWQAQQGFNETGILTTGERAVLLEQFNAVFEGLGLEMVRETTAGIEMLVPTNIVSLDGYSPPFARFTASGEIKQAQLLMISQDGAEPELRGLYDIMQTLEIVPLEGARRIRDDTFEMEGIGGDFISYTFVQTKRAKIKGFTLIWPVGDEPRRARIVQRLKDSFTPIEGTLDPTLGDPAKQAIDLISGLEIRQPLRTGSGFFIDAEGTVLTHSSNVTGCGRISLNDRYSATLAAQSTNQLAVLSSVEPLAPASYAQLAREPVQLGESIAVAGYPYDGVLRAATLTFGTLQDLRGLQGEAFLSRLSVPATSGDIGGPVMVRNNAVIGMLAPRQTPKAHALPADVHFAINSSTLTDLAEAADVTIEASDSTAQRLSPKELAQRVSEFTVLVQCWE